MNATIEDLMVKSVVTTRPHKSVGHVKDIMKTNGIQSVPVVDQKNQVDHRFVMKNPPTPSKKKESTRG